MCLADGAGPASRAGGAGPGSSGAGAGLAPGPATAAADTDALVQGAEATVAIADGTVTKERGPRDYRHPDLDARLRSERTRREARATSEARRHGVPTPVLRDVDPATHTIVSQAVGDRDLKAALDADAVAAVGRNLATIHDAGLVHGDPTVRNVRVRATAEGEGASRSDGRPRVFLIDFGLSYDSRDAEDHAMDLHVLAQSIAGVADDAETLVDRATAAYREASEHPDAVLDSLRAIEGRGRYR